MTKSQTTWTLEKTLPFILIIGGIIGLIASFIITQEKIHLLQNANYVPSCSINPILSCSPVMKSAQASAFGFPNPIVGLVGFPLVINVGVSMLAGAKFKRWYWLLFNLGTLFGIAFVHWLVHASLFDIKAICIYCCAVWTVTAPIFWYTTLYNLRQGYLPTPKPLARAVAFIQRRHIEILILWYLGVIGIIFHQFWYYWRTLL